MLGGGGRTSNCGDVRVSLLFMSESLMLESSGGKDILSLAPSESKSEKNKWINEYHKDTEHKFIEHGITPFHFSNRKLFANVEQ